MPMAKAPTIIHLAAYWPLSSQRARSRPTNRTGPTSAEALGWLDVRSRATLPRISKPKYESDHGWHHHQEGQDEQDDDTPAERGVVLAASPEEHCGGHVQILGRAHAVSKGIACWDASAANAARGTTRSPRAAKPTPTTGRSRPGMAVPRRRSDRIASIRAAAVAVRGRP